MFIEQLELERTIEQLNFETTLNRASWTDIEQLSSFLLKGGMGILKIGQQVTNH